MNPHPADRERPHCPHVMIAEVTEGSAILPRLRELDWGRMFCFKPITPAVYERWGFDNGAFKAWQDAEFAPNLPIDDWCILWSAEEYRERFAQAMSASCDPLVAIVPDIPGSIYSLEWSLDWIAELRRDASWPWYLAVQDGMETEQVREVLHLFDGVFLGGTDKFKLQAYRWLRLAHSCQKKFHYGRAGTPTKLKHAMKIGADSLDSSYPLWTKPRFKEFAELWLCGDGQERIEAFA